MDGFVGVALGAGFAPGRLLTSLTSGTPPSFACTVRSCRKRRSRRTKVLRHFAHLNGRSLVSGNVGRKISKSRQNVGFTTPPWEEPLHRLRGKVGRHLRDLSCLLLCSLRLNARAQNWHLYFLSGTCCAFAGLDTCATEAVAVAAAGIVESLTRIPRVKRKRLSDTETSMSMDWTYAK